MEAKVKRNRRGPLIAAGILLGPDGFFDGILLHLQWHHMLSSVRPPTVADLGIWEWVCLRLVPRQVGPYCYGGRVSAMMFLGLQIPSSGLYCWCGSFNLVEGLIDIKSSAFTM